MAAAAGMAVQPLELFLLPKNADGLRRVPWLVQAVR